MSIYMPRTVRDDPRDMPEFRAGLLDMAQPGSVWEAAEEHRGLQTVLGNFTSTSVDHAMFDGGVMAGPNGLGPDELIQAMSASQARLASSMNWARLTVERSQLVWMSDELCDVLYSSFDTVPTDRVLDITDPPSPCGLIVFQTPFLGIDAGDTYETVRVDAMMWGPVNLPPKDEPVFGTEGVLPGIALAAFRYMNPSQHTDPAAVKLRDTIVEQGQNPAGDMWIPLGRSDWVIGDRISDTTHDQIDPESDTHASMVEDRKLFAALWALIREKRIVTQTEVAATRHARKRLARRGHDDRPVTVVHLRRPEYRPRHDDDDHARRIGVRFAVRGHWRNQAYGPNRSLRKLILIPPHMKGPSDAPLAHTERVWAVDQ